MPRSTAGAGVGSALNSFMKYDRKWRGKEGVKVSVKKAETDSDSEPVISENSVASPVKIAEELEEKIFPHRSVSNLRKETLLYEPTYLHPQKYLLNNVKLKKHS